MRQTNLSSQLQKIEPWWQIINVVTFFSFLFAFFVGSMVRFLVGLPNPTLDEAGIEFLAWIGYTICWIVFAVVGHSKQNFYKYLPWSVLVLILAIVATFLIP